MQLDQYMRPVDLPFQPGSFVNGMAFNTYYDRNSVTAINLRNFSFNAGTGGTIVLGGTNNGNGNFILRNSAGSTIVTGNNQGITVTNGSITINNSNGSVSFDARGVVSTANFTNDQLVDVTQRTTTSTTPVDVPGAAFNSFVLSRKTRALVTIGAAAYNNAFSFTGDTMQLMALDSIDGTVLNYPISSAWSLTNIDFVGHSYTTDDENIWSSMSALIDFSAGTHNLKLQFYVNSGGTAKINLYQFSYILLGL